jgi:hypothetical protein
MASGTSGFSSPDSYTGPDGNGGQTVGDVENGINPINISEQQNADLQSAFEMSIFNVASTTMSQGSNQQKKIFEDSNKEEQRHKTIMGMIKQGLT